MVEVSRIESAEHGAAKDETYLRDYQRELGHLLDQPIKLLELGVQRGASMRLWLEVFPAAQIAGLDLNRITVPDTSGRLHVYQGYQQDPEVLDRIAADVAPDGFDVIIDDASHVGQYTAASFWHLFPRHLKSGGIYVLEDWSCGYWPHWPDGHGYTGDWATLGEDPAVAHPSRLEAVQRRVRSSARGVAGRLNQYPAVRSKLFDLYMRSERLALQRRFPSHDYGMVGFVKQLVDATAVDMINAEHGEATSRTAMIDRLTVTQSQVFVHKKR